MQGLQRAFSSRVPPLILGLIAILCSRTAQQNRLIPQGATQLDARRALQGEGTSGGRGWQLSGGEEKFVGREKETRQRSVI